MAGNDPPTGTTPTPAPASTSNNRSHGRASTNKRQAPRIHVSGSHGSTHGVCEVCHPCTSPHQRFSRSHLSVSVTASLVLSRQTDLSTFQLLQSHVCRQCCDDVQSEWVLASLSVLAHALAQRECLADVSYSIVEGNRGPGDKVPIVRGLAPTKRTASKTFW